VEDFRDPLHLCFVSSHAQKTRLAISEEQITNLLLDVVKGIWRVHGETDQDDVGVGVGKRTETVVVLLASRIPEGELDVLSIDFDIGNVVLEDGWDVDLKGNTKSVTRFIL
jgi:hypothetical protein